MVIVGGGVIGVAIAYNLARRGLKDVVLLEKEPFLCAGSTARAAGGIRAQFSSPANVIFSMCSEEIFEHFPGEMDSPATFEQVGYLFLLSKESDWETFKKNAQMQRNLGLPVELLTPKEVLKLAPFIDIADIIGATFCHKDGLGDPGDFSQGYITAARRLGVEFILEAEVTAILMSNSKVTGIVSQKGTFATEQVVNAAGPSAALIGRMIGVEIPVQPIKRQVVTTAPLPYVKPDLPMVVDVDTGLYFHRESGGLLLGWADKSTPSGFDQSVDPNYTDSILERALLRIPQLAEAQIARAWAGLYETSTDNNAILGKVPGLEGFICANGFSGHGFMHAPAVGQTIAELIVEGKTSLDSTPFAIERFLNGQVQEETNII